MTVDDARAILLAMPEAYESSHHGHPDFRIAKGIFATLWPDQERSVLRLPMLLAESLEAEDAERYKIVGRSGGMGWLSIALHRTDTEEYAGLAEVAWQARGGRVS